MSTSSKEETTSPWDELDDQAECEARVIVDAIKKAKEVGATEIEVHGLLSRESTENLRRKNFVVDALNTAGGIVTVIRFSGKVRTSVVAGRGDQAAATSSSGEEQPPRVEVNLARQQHQTSADEVSPAFLMMQQREMEAAQFARQQAAFHQPKVMRPRRV